MSISSYAQRVFCHHSALVQNRIKFIPVRLINSD
jgi:hypothetical protein